MNHLARGSQFSEDFRQRALHPLHAVFGIILRMADSCRLIFERIKSPLECLLAAYDYAPDNDSDRWQLAVEMGDLLSRGAAVNDIRWLLLRGYAAHAKETTIPGDPTRQFRALAPTSLPLDACFILLQQGAQAIRAAFEAPAETIDATNVVAKSSHSSQPRCEGNPLLPAWDESRRELRYGAEIIKRYRVPAPNQALILAAFQEMDWPESIDDPLPPDGEQEPKRRLQATIKSMNRNQLAQRIRFHGNGKGLQVWWEVIPPT